MDAGGYSTLVCEWPSGLLDQIKWGFRREVDNNLYFCNLKTLFRLIHNCESYRCWKFDCIFWGGGGGGSRQAVQSCHNYRAQLFLIKVQLNSLFWWHKFHMVWWLLSFLIRLLKTEVESCPVSWRWTDGEGTWSRERIPSWLVFHRGTPDGLKWQWKSIQNPITKLRAIVDVLHEFNSIPFHDQTQNIGYWRKKRQKTLF